MKGHTITPATMLELLEQEPPENIEWNVDGRDVIVADLNTITVRISKYADNGAVRCRIVAIEDALFLFSEEYKLEEPMGRRLAELLAKVRAHLDARPTIGLEELRRQQLAHAARHHGSWITRIFG